jgi:undecaprenyl-diphosphatase
VDQESVINVILLGFIEGLTEFLPISSTGHLILLGELLGFTGRASSTFKIVIQLGAILAVLVAYHRRFIDIAVRLPTDPSARAWVRNILLGFLPASIVGAFAYSAIKVALETPILVAVALIVGGVAILIIERLQHVVRFKDVERMPGGVAFTVGVGQCLAMIPGVSRSGATIMGALLLGVERKTAAEFSFFLAVPTMIAATAYDLYKSRDILDFNDMTAIGLGFLVAFVTALAAVRLFIGLVGRYGFAPFAWYRIVIGAVSLVWLLGR